jgi:hypothetical protein
MPTAKKAKVVVVKAEPEAKPAPEFAGVIWEGTALKLRAMIKDLESSMVLDNLCHRYTGTILVDWLPESSLRRWVSTDG